MKILIVDDCGTTRKLLGLYLRANGYETATAENGLDALEKLGTDNINLVLTDLNMPYMDGMELIKNIRSNPELSHMPVIMVTTEADPEERERAIKSGANGYLVKPVTSAMIASSIKNIMKEIFSKGGLADV